MAHQFHLENEKYRQWVKAGLGLGYLKEGLAPFCNDIAKQQHKDILDNIKLTKNLPIVTCGQCALRTLKPDHAKIGNKQCPFRHANCNCCYTSGKIVCPNNVCGAIYDRIITNHASTPPAPYWKNTQAQQWTRDPWSIAKCFINAPGYDQKTSAVNIDCTGLLHVIINNKYFHNHIQCNVAGANVFSKVRQYRNEIFHSSTMELEEADANTYIDDMIAVLQDGKELINRKDSQEVVKKLKELKNEKFIITTENMEKVLGEIREEMENVRTLIEGLATKEECEDLKRKFSALESVMFEQAKEMKRLKADDSIQKELWRSDYEKSKLDFQKILLSHYRQSLLQVSAIPLKPERKHCNFNKVYVRPRITRETKDENRRPEETEIQSMSDIFTKGGKPMKSIYVLGNAGSGKSSFCKSLVSDWYTAHSGEQTVEDKFDGIKEMKKFEFLFYVSLRRFKDVVSIQEMLEKQYKCEIVNEILNKESRDILIVLDGLDEWTCKTVTSNQFQTEGLPERDISKDYTVITTSRPWKIETLGVTDQEIEQRLNLEGFDKSSVKTMIYQTVPVLNKSFGKNKSPSACEDTLDNKAIASMINVPIMLLQMICLWFDDNLQVSSRCAVYSAMLELFFSWNDKKKKEEEDRIFRKMRDMSKDLQNFELPQYLMNNKLCNLYKYLIQELSRLAYETLFTSEKEASLTFDSSVFEKLGISEEVKTSCLKLGILSEDGCPSLYASTSDSSLLSFIHKSVQEYLAAVYIAVKFKAHIGSSAYSENPEFLDHCAPFIKEVFSNSKTFDEILEQVDVFIMLCGLEPQIAMPISKYMYDIVTRDKCVLEYRRTLYSYDKLILGIQKCILNCTKEVQACNTNIPFKFDLGDIIVNVLWSFSRLDHFCTSIDDKYMSPGSVRSFNLCNHVDSKECNTTALKYLPKCRRLESIKVDHFSGDEQVKCICGVIEVNTSTLKSLSVKIPRIENLYPMYKTIVRCLPDMCQLVALNIEGLILPHEYFTSLCTFLSGSSHLEQISITDTSCEFSKDYTYIKDSDTSTDSKASRNTDSDTSTDSETSRASVFTVCKNQHEVDLSKHQQLQLLVYDFYVTVTRVHTSNLAFFEFRHLNRENMEVFDILSAANKLTTLELWYDIDVGYPGKLPPYHTLTKKLIILLPLLHQLREITLQSFTFTDNIIKCPSEMKSVKFIHLDTIRMSFTTWQQLVDSLPLIPLSVEVNASDLWITRDGEEYYPYSNWIIVNGGGEEKAGLQYVREQETLFNVDFVNRFRENTFDFSTKK